MDIRTHGRSLLKYPGCTMQKVMHDSYLSSRNGTVVMLVLFHWLESISDQIQFDRAD